LASVEGHMFEVNCLGTPVSGAKTTLKKSVKGVMYIVELKPHKKRV
jgi:hypothetical protein